MPHLELDVGVRYAGGRFELMRLNGNGEVFGLSPNAYSLLCLFDGHTSEADAVAHAGMLWGEGRGAPFVEELRALVRYGDFEARPPSAEGALAEILRAR